MSTDLRQQVLDQIERILKEDSLFSYNEGLYKKDLIYAFEDIFLVTLVSEFYRKHRTNNFIDFLRYLDINYVKNNFVNLYKIFSDFRFELKNSANKYTGNSMRFVGDVHPGQTTKIKIDDKILYNGKFSNQLLILDLVRKTAPRYLSYFPNAELTTTTIIRDYIEPQINTKRYDLVIDYYFNLGFIIPFILYLRFTDLFAENMIISLPYPIFFDTECILMPSNDLLSEYNLEYTGIIKRSERDYSLLTGGTTPVESLLKPVLSGNINKPRILWRSISKGKFFNVPTLENNKVEVFHYKDQIVNGVVEGYKYVQEVHKDIDKYISEHKIYSRILIRPSRIYKLAMCKYYYPHNHLKHNPEDFFVNEMKELDMIFSVLGENNEFRNKIVWDESRVLSKNMIPIFYSEIHSTSVFNSLGIKMAEFKYSQYETFKNYKENFFDNKSSNVNLLKNSLSNSIVPH